MILMKRIRRQAKRSSAIANDTSAVALVEFAYSLPLLLCLGTYGVEVSNLALTNMRISQIAISTADNASRVGVDSPLALKQLREADIDDILQAARLQGTGIDLSNRGRVTISSLETSGTNQSIHWQRCLGKKSGTGYDSSYGIAPTDDSGLVVTGMGDSGQQVTAPAGEAVMFVEVNYDYRPVLPLLVPLLGATTRLHYTSSFIVRDKRDLTQVYNSTSTKQTCDKHNI